MEQYPREYLCLSDLLEQDLSAYEFFQTLSEQDQQLLRSRSSEVGSFSDLQDQAAGLRAEPEWW